MAPTATSPSPAPSLGSRPSMRYSSSWRRSPRSWFAIRNLKPSGLRRSTPASLFQQRAGHSQARDMIGTLNADETARRIAAAVPFLERHAESTGKVGAVGFCWGGGMVNRVAVLAPDLKAGIAYYGAQPPAEQVKSIHSPLLLHYAGLDQRINACIPAYEAALKAAGKRFAVHVYPNVNHAFNNDTSNRYDKPAADLAWSRSIAFFKENLGSPPKA